MKRPSIDLSTMSFNDTDIKRHGCYSYLFAKTKEANGVRLSPQTTGPIHTARPEVKYALTLLVMYEG